MGKSTAMVLISLIALVLVTTFQNCTPTKFENQSQSSARSGGQGYDGKVYIVDGECADGTRVSSRLILTSPQTATLVRHNCVDLPGTQLGAGDFSFDSADPTLIRYESLLFTPEMPSVPVKPLLRAYLQWSNTPRSIATPSIYMADANYSQAELDAIKAAGHTVICLITAGVTNSRDIDYSSFRAADIGNEQIGAPGDYWLDTRSANVRSIMISKLERARAKGCAGVLWDQTDAHVSSSGFPLSATTGVDFARFLAFATHDRKLLAVFANTGDLSASVVDYFDMQYGENCNQKGSCERYKPFADKQKPVLIADTGTYSAALCEHNSKLNFSLWFTSTTADGSRYEPCP